MNTHTHTPSDLISYDIKSLGNSMEFMAQTLANHSATLANLLSEGAAPDTVAHWASVIASDASQLLGFAKQAQGMEKARARLGEQ